MKPILPALISRILIGLFFFACCSPGKLFAQASENTINLKLSGLKPISKIDERFQSFNVEMVEVVGGNFWIPYDKIDTTQKPGDNNVVMGQTKSLYRAIPPINLYEKRLTMLAAALGPTYIRVSGSWANSTYFQNNDKTKMTTAPPGFKNVLSRKEWKGVVDFSKAVNAKLVNSFAISDGVRDKDGIWTPDQAKALVNYTKLMGGSLAAAELFNEPTFAGYGGAPKGYNAATFAKDIAVFKTFVKSSLPKMIVLGPGSVGEGGMLGSGNMAMLKTDDLLSADPRPTFDVFSYHFYGGVSKRCAGEGPGSMSPKDALSPAWLNKTLAGYNYYKGMRDKYLSGKPIWLTETADAACGGNPWAATFLDCFRYVEQLGKLAKEGVQVVMHNTLSASEYGLIDQDSHQPRPNYWTALLWSRFMGTDVYDAGSSTPGVDIFVHSLKKRSGGMTLLIVNTLSTTAAVTIPSNAEQYSLTADELQTKKIQLNGEDLSLTANDELPVIKGKPIKAGVIQMAPHSITFLTFASIKK
ncbi:MAG: hypothetical protein ABIN01_12520 [Ferruginibacter sp.]